MAIPKEMADLKNLTSLCTRIKSDKPLQLKDIHLESKRIYFEYQGTKFAIVVNPS